MLSKYAPLTGATRFPPMKFSYRARSGILRSIVLRCAAKELISLMGALSCAELVGRTWALIIILLGWDWIQLASRATCRPAVADDASRCFARQMPQKLFAASHHPWGCRVYSHPRCEASSAWFFLKQLRHPTGLRTATEPPSSAMHHP